MCNDAPSVSIPIWTIVAHVLLIDAHAFLLDAHASCCYVRRPSRARSCALCIHVMLTSGLFHSWQSIPLVMAFVMASIVKNVTVHVICLVPAFVYVTTMTVQVHMHVHVSRLLSCLWDNVCNAPLLRSSPGVPSRAMRDYGVFMSP